MYSLYRNTSEFKLEIKKLPEGKLFIRTPLEGNEVRRYNDCYYICNERKPLAVLGNKIKNDLIEEQKEILAKLEAMKNFR